LQVRAQMKAFAVALRLAQQLQVDAADRAEARDRNRRREPVPLGLSRVVVTGQRCVATLQTITPAL